MKKIVIYTGFVITCLADVVFFLSTTTYVQLAIAIALYLILIYFALKLFPRKTQVESAAIETVPVAPNDSTVELTPPIQDTSEVSEGVEILDIDKRAFLKLIGAAGLSFFLSSLFSKRAETLLLGKAEGLGLTKIQDPAGDVISPAKHHPTDNYKISEVDYGISTFYGFMDQGEGWFIMKEDLNAGTYRYIKGDSNFHSNWNNQEGLNYDYFNQVFPKP